MRITPPRVLGGAALALAVAGPVAAGDAFDRLEAMWSHLHEYSVTIEAHEVLGTESDDHKLQYTFRKPDRARLDVVAGTKSGSTIVWDGGDRVVAYRRNFSLFKMHGSARQKDLTSLRGNGILSPNMGDLVSCFGQHRDAMHEREGPAIDGEPTDEVALNYTNVTCPDDPPTDRAVTLDVIDVSKKTGLILERRRLEGEEVVERWDLTDYKVDTGITDDALR